MADGHALSDGDVVAILKNVLGAKPRAANGSPAPQLVAVMAAAPILIAIAWWNYILVEPFGEALLLAALAATFWLRIGAREFIARPIAGIQRRIRSLAPKAPGLTAAAAVCLAAALVVAVGGGSITAAAVLVLGLAVTMGCPRRAASVVILLATAAAVAIPALAFLRTLLDDALVLKRVLTEFAQHDAVLDSLLEQMLESPLRATMQDRAQALGVSLPMPTPDDAKGAIEAAATWLSSNVTLVAGSALALAANLSTFLVATTTFLTALYFFLESAEDIAKHVTMLSPFDPGDARALAGQLQESVRGIVLYSGAVFLLQFSLTLASFVAAAVPGAYTLAFLSGFLAMFPLLSNWVVWVPAVFMLVVQGEWWRAVVVAAAHLAGHLVLLPRVVGLIPGNSWYIGLFLASGVYVLGPSGIVTGPLVACVTKAALDLVAKYNAASRLEERELDDAVASLLDQDASMADAVRQAVGHGVDPSPDNAAAFLQAVTALHEGAAAGGGPGSQREPYPEVDDSLMSSAEGDGSTAESWAGEGPSGCSGFPDVEGATPVRGDPHTPASAQGPAPSVLWGNCTPGSEGQGGGGATGRRPGPGAHTASRVPLPPRLPAAGAHRLSAPMAVGAPGHGGAGAGVGPRRQTTGDVAPAGGAAGGLRAGSLPGDGRARGSAGTMGGAASLFQLLQRRQQRRVRARGLAFLRQLDRVATPGSGSPSRTDVAVGAGTAAGKEPTAPRSAPQERRHVEAAAPIPGARRHSGMAALSSRDGAASPHQEGVGEAEERVTAPQTPAERVREGAGEISPPMTRSQARARRRRQFSA